MPYARNRELPSAVRSSLPWGAQTIFRKAFNSADEQYDDESRARRVAWAAVKKKYAKDRAGEWRKKG